MLNAKQVVSRLLDEDLHAKMPYLLQQFPKLSQEQIEQVAEIDPTVSKAYTAWLLKQIQLGHLRQGEDNETARSTLSDFDKFKKKGNWKSPRDINQYKQLGDLHKAVSDVHLSPVSAITGQAPESSKPLGQSGSFRIYNMTDPGALAASSKHTAWCTKDMEISQYYLSKGPVFMVTKSAKPCVLIQPKTLQLRDIHDRTLGLSDVDTIFPLIKQGIPLEEWPPIESDFNSQRIRLLAQKKRDYLHSNNAKVDDWERMLTDNPWFMSARDDYERSVELNEPFIPDSTVEHLYLLLGLLEKSIDRASFKIKNQTAFKKPKASF